MFKEGDLVVYAPTDSEGRVYKTEIGKFKRYNSDESCAFVYYHSGDTAASTPVEYLYKLNNYYFINTCLGSGDEYLSQEIEKLKEHLEHAKQKAQRARIKERRVLWWTISIRFDEKIKCYESIMKGGGMFE